ncbi:hypothetical protein DMA29_11275 [Salmonella enterica subsp. enterica serovar Seattle]|uniref:hypothetical protein n=1 Tax=Salmonella enterica TaxID=28901 RepID=UPI0012F0165A|nr:hypothetical protein [Salmonella enterica]EBU8871955.1 hypothetical protein [Salmonella enterica subsp. enterica serovar Seattle]
MKAVQSVFVPQTLWGNSSLSIGWLTIDSTPPVLITIPVTGMFLFRNPLFCRGGENQYIITATAPAGNSATANGTFTGTSPTENPVNKSSGVDEMISLSEATWHSVSVDEEYYA